MAAHKSHPLVTTLPGNLVEVRPGRRLFVVRHFLRHEAPTLFFIHGSCATWLQFDRQVEEFRHSHNIIAYDAFGCGQSDQPAGWYCYNEEEIYADVKTLFQQHKAAKTILVAHSFGTCIAARLAADPDTKSHVAGAMLLGASHAHPSGGPHPIFRLPVWLLRCLRHRMHAAFVAAAYHQATSTEVIEGENQKTAGNTLAMAKAFYRQLRWNCDGCWEQITCPVTLVTGEADKLTPVRHAVKVTHVVRHARLHVIAHASHQVMVEQPGAVHDLLHDLIRQVHGAAEKK